MRTIVCLLTLTFLCIGCDSLLEIEDSLLVGTWEFVQAKFDSENGVEQTMTPEEYGREITAVFNGNGRFELTYVYPDRTNVSTGSYKTLDNDWLELDFYSGPTILSHYHVTEEHLDFGLGDYSGQYIPIVWEFVRVVED